LAGRFAVLDDNAPWRGGDRFFYIVFFVVTLPRNSL